MGIRVIITGATGMVGEGVLLTCLENKDIDKVLVVGRRPYGLKHPKVSELIVPDFFQLSSYETDLSGYDACFYCAGVSAAGMKAADYRRNTYDTTLNFAQTLAKLNLQMVFVYVSGLGTDSSEKGSMMWARVKGETENALMKLPFKKVYNFRPGLMKPVPGQKNIKLVYKVIAGLYPAVRALFPRIASTLYEVGDAMANSVLKGYNSQILEVKDINILAKQ